MKKILLFVLTLTILLLSTVAIADIDISGCSYDELVELVNEAQKLMMKSDNWQKVEVPAGIYTIGVDIPAGHWTIKSIDTLRYITLQLGKELDEDGSGIKWGEYIFSEMIYGINGKSYENGKTTFVSWELKDGQYLVIDDGTAVFTPYAGNSFSFK